MEERIRVLESIISNLQKDVGALEDRQTLIVQNIIKVAKGEDVKLVV